MIRRGDVWWADLGIPRGSAPGFRRPVLVISADPYNRSEIATVTVVVLTTNQRLASLPGNVAVPADATRLPNDSVINVTSVATIDRNALEEHVGTLPEWAVERVDQGLSRALGLGRGRIPTR